MPPDTVEETPVVVETPIVETPKPVTLAETEARLREQRDRQLGRDPAKLVDTRPKTVVVATKVEDTPVKVEEPEKPKTSGRAARRFAKFDRMFTTLSEQNQQLQNELAELKKGKTPVVDTPATVELKEPERSAYATVEEWIAAVREFDKKQTEQDLDKARKESERLTQEEQAEKAIGDFNKRLTEVKAKHDDWDDKADKLSSSVGFGGTLLGVLLTADLEILYELASDVKGAKQLGELSDQSSVAVGNSDDVTSVLRYLVKNPKEVKTLNDLSPTKAAKYIGKLEVRIEEESKVASPAKGDTPNPPTPASGPQKGEPAKPAAEPARREPAPTPKPAPPPVLSGAPPATEDYRDPSLMSFAERERLYKLAHKRK